MLDTNFGKDINNYLYKDSYYIVNNKGICCLTDNFREELNSNKWGDKPLPNIPKEATSLSHLFSDINNVKILNLINFNMSNIIDMSYMFSNCKSLIFVKLPDVKPTKIFSAHSMFSGCESLNSFILDDLLVTNFKDIYDKIKNCPEIWYFESVFKIFITNKYIIYLIKIVILLIILFK